MHGERNLLRALTLVVVLAAGHEAWAAPVIARIEPAQATALGRSIAIKIHGSGFAPGDQVELRREDVPALRGRSVRVRSDSMSGDREIDITVPAEWMREPGILLMHVVSTRGEASNSATLPLLALRLTPGHPLDALPSVRAVPDAVRVEKWIPVTIRGGPFEAGMRYAVTNLNPPVAGRCGSVLVPHGRLEVIDSTTARISVFVGCFTENPIRAFRLMDRSGDAITAWIKIEETR